MDREIQMRLGWVQLYEETQNAGFVCRRCGVSRPTLRKWIRRYKANGLEPYAYLKHVFTELPKATSVEDIEVLLPFKLKLELDKVA